MFGAEKKNPTDLNVTLYTITPTLVPHAVRNDTMEELSSGVARFRCEQNKGAVKGEPLLRRCRGISA